MFGFGVVWIGDFWWFCGFAGLVYGAAMQIFRGCLLIVGLWGCGCVGLLFFSFLWVLCGV